MATAQVNLARKHIYIPATQSEDRITLRVAAYCRVSSDSDDQLNSFAAQNTHYNTLISSNDRWELVDIYADEGITGTSTKKRHDFQRMLEDCRKGKIDKILVKSISRFARNTTDCLETIRELKMLGVSVYFEEHNIDTKMVTSEMLTAVLASCAQAESESISRNMRWGVQKRMERGTYVSSSAPYGFRLVNKELVVEDGEAEVVKRIFDDYLSGFTPADIAQMLIREGNTDRLWRESTIKYILRNERYTGCAILQKSYTTQTLPFERRKNNGECPMFRVSNANPVIIPMEVYESVQRLIQNRFKVRASMPGEHPLASHVICGRCGSICTVRYNRGKSYISCRNHDENAAQCEIKPIRTDSIIRAFLRLYYNLKHNIGIFRMLIDKMYVVRNRQMLWNPNIVEINKQISDITSQSHRLSSLNKRGMVDPDIFISKSNQLAEQLRKAKQQKEKLLNRENDTFIENTRELLDILSDAPEFLDTFDEELFCELIDKIVVDSNTQIRFRLRNGLELPEAIERMNR